MNIPSEEDKQRWLDRVAREGLSIAGRQAFTEMVTSIEETIEILKGLEPPEQHDLVLAEQLGEVRDFLNLLLEASNKE